VPGIQLAHAGRKASHASPWKGGQQIKLSEGGWKTVAPSAIPFKENEEPPGGMSLREIEKVIEDFAAAARRSLLAGFRVLEIHAAHGYLLNEFLSPLSNHRTDEYGGSFDNRIRMLLQVVEKVQSVWPSHLPLFVRISAIDWAEGGWNLEDSVKLSAILKSKGIDLVDCSSGGLVHHQKIETGPGYQVPFASTIKKETGIMTGAVGLITTPQQAEEILADNQADLIIMAREMLRDPYFALHAALALGEDVKWPEQYLRAKPGYRSS
jgi:2,4-dienoyl-CoA reductase-like NADH-dependent reductase (Old Yellow Enzyme family)